MRTFKAKVLQPQTAWESVVSNAYHASMSAAGRDGIREMQTRDNNGDPLIAGAMANPTRTRDASFYRGEYDRLTADVKARVGSLAQYVSKRQAGLVDAHGKPTG